MLLVDSSIWIDHFRDEIAALSTRLRRREIMTHQFVIGELVLGHLRHPEQVIRNLLALPQALMASSNEVLNLILSGNLSGSGIGYVDAHLLASSRLTPGTVLWTRDKRLQRVAGQLSIAIYPQ